MYQSPNKAFNDMLYNNFATSSVTKHQQESVSGQSVDQYVRLNLGSQNASRWYVTVRQPNNTTVVTDSIGTPDAGYVRYVSIKTKQKNKSNKPLNLTPLLNVWGKSTDKTTPLTNLFSQAVLDIRQAPMLPVGNLSAEHRNNLLEFIHDNNVFVPDYRSAQKKKVNGKDVYEYQVKVNLAQYIQLSKAFAQDLGLHDLDTADPSASQNVKPANLIVDVDRESHQLVRASYPDGNYAQSYSDYGIIEPIKIPSKTIPVSELANRLQNLH